MNKYAMTSAHQAVVIYKPDLIRIITQHVPHATIYLFNAHAMGLSSEPSDIDLAIDAGYEIDPAAVAAIVADIDAMGLHFFVDVVDLNTVYEALRDDIKQHGVVWTV